MTASEPAVERLLRSLDGAAPPAAEAVVAAATALRRPGRAIDVERPATPLEVLRDRIADFSDAVAGVAEEQWHLPADPYPWTVHQLVAHLAAIEEYVAHLLGIPAYGPPAAADHDHLAMTEPAVEAAATAEPGATVGRWRTAAIAVAEHLEQGGDAALDRRLRFHGLDLSVSSLLIVRGFELWTHADDVRRATARAPVDPPPDVIHTMSSLSVRALPFLLVPPAPATARVVLTGSGGGVWTLALGGADADADGDHDVEILAEAAGWCRLASRRLDPDRLGASVDGDPALAARLFDAAQAMAF